MGEELEARGGRVGDNLPFPRAEFGNKGRPLSESRHIFLDTAFPSIYSLHSVQFLSPFAIEYSMPRPFKLSPHKHRTWLKCLELERRGVPSRPLPLLVISVAAETGSPIVKSYDAETGLLNFERTVYESTFTGGVRIATADFTGDGYPDLAVGPGMGGPRVRITLSF